ncbi:unnamed protein product [Brassica rapa subsp. narinosa]
MYTNVFWRTYRFRRSITVSFEFEISSRDLTPPNDSDYAENQFQENVIVLLRRQKRWKTCLGMSHVE